MSSLTEEDLKELLLLLRRDFEEHGHWDVLEYPIEVIDSNVCKTAELWNKISLMLKKRAMNKKHECGKEMTEAELQIY